MREADVLLFSGVSLISKFIRRFTGSEWSHIGVLSHNKDNMQEVLEFREWKGGLHRPFIDVLRESNKQIDVFRPVYLFQSQSYNKKTKKIEVSETHFRPKRVTNTFRGMLSMPYSWKRIAYLSKFYLLGARLLYNNGETTLDDPTRDLFPVCSTAVAHAFNLNGFDLVKNRSDSRTVPGDLAMSARLSYLFTPYL